MDAGRRSLDGRRRRSPSGSSNGLGFAEVHEGLEGVVGKLGQKFKGRLRALTASGREKEEAARVAPYPGT